MFERYVEKARFAIVKARDEANRTGSPVIDSEHLLLGIVQEDPDLVAYLALPSALAVRSQLKAGPNAVAQPELPLSTAAKLVLSRAAAEAERLGHDRIAPIHLLMGLLHDEESLAYELLKNHGVTLPQVEQLSLAPPAEPAMMQMIVGFWASRAIYTAAKLGIPDLLKDGAKSTAELATATASHPEALYRMLRALASIGVFTELDNQRFATTPLGKTLEDRPGSMRYWAMAELGQEHFSAWEELPYSIRTGGLAFHEKFKQPVWEYYAAHHEHAQVFNSAMSNLTDWVTHAILATYDFSPFHKIVDIGGGHGGFLTAILGAAPAAHGVLFDAPPVIAQASRLAEAGFTGRSEQVGGSFFEAVPAGGDLYTLKMIIHDWNDDESHSILANIRKAMAPRGKLLIVEMVLGPGPEAPLKNFLDLNMMVMTGGRERTEAGYRALLEKAGFRLTRIVPTASPMSIVEAVGM